MRFFRSRWFVAFALTMVFVPDLPLAAGESRKFVRYEDFGAKGDGKADDMAAIVKAHAHANAEGLPVRAKDGATYYIGGGKQTALIQTDTNFGKAKFVIDDRELEDIRAFVFEVRSELDPIHPKGIERLRRNQRRIPVSLPRPSVMVVTNSAVKHYIRRGLNPNKGSSQTDVLKVGKAGEVDPANPILWDFDQVTNCTAYPIDERVLRLQGGQFTTIANQADSKYQYHSRGISVRRSRVLVEGLEHRITGEGDHGAPYRGFVSISNCADVVVRDCTLSGHKTYRTIGRANKPVSMGTYDISVTRALNVSFVNCRQFNDINDRSRWGIMASNFCKNLTLDKCSFSRFDAHQGVFNATIRDSTLGHVGINAIGHGRLLVENTKSFGRYLINLRSDYGSTWRGVIVIRDCVFVPAGGARVKPVLINGFNDGQHDFGYTCFMPEKILIDGLKIEDSKHPKNYAGPTLFGNFNPKFGREGFTEKFPYVRTEEVRLRGVVTASGEPLRLSKNPAMFEEVEVKRSR